MQASEANMLAVCDPGLQVDYNVCGRTTLTAPKVAGVENVATFEVFTTAIKNHCLNGFADGVQKGDGSINSFV